MMMDVIQVGVTAHRRPDGSFEPAVPLYIAADEAAKASEEKLEMDIAKIFAAKFAHYLEGTGQTI